MQKVRGNTETERKSKGEHMIITKDITRKDGIRTVTVQLAEGEKLKAFKEDNFYRLGGQIADVVGGYCITRCSHVVWCSIEQKWVEA